MLTAMTTPGSGAKDWQRLAKYVVDRRNAYGWTQEDVRAAGGPSTATMRLIEGALQDSYKPRVIASLERALLWKPGSVDEVLAGKEPIEEAGVPATLEQQMELLIESARNPAVPWESQSVRDAVVAFASDTLRRMREESSNPGSTSVG